MSAFDGFGLGGDAGLRRQPGAGGQCTFGEAGRAHSASACSSRDLASSLSPAQRVNARQEPS